MLHVAFVSVLSWTLELYSFTNIQVNRIFVENAFDAVMHFAAVAYVGESTLDPLRYDLYKPCDIK